MARHRWRIPMSAAVLAVVVTMAMQAMPSDGNAATSNDRTATETDVAPDPTTKVTLITGDTVVLRGKAPQQIRPGPGRSDVRFTTTWLDGDLYVIPSDARRSLAEGRLDERLFDVTRLVEWEYDDSHGDELPLLAERSDPEQGIRAAHAELDATFESSGMDALTVAKSDATAFWNSVLSAPEAKSFDAGVGRLWLDGKVQASLDESVPQVGAPAAWERGYDGTGALVAVLDTGYAKQHPDLQGVVKQSKGFTSQGADDVDDQVGHGTHVASTIAGSGAKSDGKYKGVAPGAEIAVGKVLDDFGYGQESWILRGMEWAANDVDADVVNMSLGATDTQGLDPMERAVNRLTKRTGTLFVVAAGNEGEYGDQTIGSPGSADSALTVGAVDGSDRLAEFSSRGPRVGDHAVKPDLTAPGVNIKAAVPAQSYASYSGTSMATPHVAGAAAILAQQHPKWTAERLASALIGSTKPTPESNEYQQGSGRLDIARAVDNPVTASSGNLSTYVRYPDGGGTADPVTRTLTYANQSDRPVTLTLRAPDGPFALSDSRITVPPNGTKRVDLTIDPKGVQAGDYKGTLVASGDGVKVRTILGAYVEPKAYDLQAQLIDRHGEPVNGLLLLHSQTEAYYEWAWFENGKADLRLPAGGYNLAGEVETPKPQEPWGWTLVNQPVDLRHGDQHVVIDTREAKRPTVTIDDPALEHPGYSDALVQYENRDASYTVGGGWDTGTMSVLPARQRGLSYFRSVSFTNKGRSDYYNVVDHREGGIPADPTYQSKVDELAEVDFTFRSTDERRDAEFLLGLSLPGGIDLPALMSEFETPATVRRFVTPSGEFGWWQSFFDYQMILESDTPVRYSSGQHEETWGAAAFGPALPKVCYISLSGPTGPCATRTGNRLSWIGDGSLVTDAARSSRRAYLPPKGTVTLTDSDGTVLDRIDLGREYEVAAKLPSRPGRYTLSVDARQPWATLSTEIDAVYTFESGRTDAETALPFLAVRMAPEGLGKFNRAAAGSRTTVPMWVERYGPARVKSLEVEVSYDDGEHWRPLRVRGNGDAWKTTVRNPESGFVSFRATATDLDGNSVVQTVNRAYAIR